MGYLFFLKNAFKPTLMVIMKNYKRCHEKYPVIQQDGTSPHYALPVWQIDEA